jgi:lipoyl(octanoyl) transferase
MIPVIKYIDLGLTEYGTAWNFQKKLFDKSLEIKKTGQKLPDNYLIFCEHPHVFTLGKSGSVENLLVDNEELKNKGATFFRIDRGGDITYHGPGQIVGYPVLDLSQFNMGVKDYVHSLEETIIDFLINYKIKAERLEGATGVWLDAIKNSNVRKICAIGVKISRWISMHGFALNVNTDLGFFNYINPCGFIDKGVTSLEKELGKKAEMDHAKKQLISSFEKVFGAKII